MGKIFFCLLLFNLIFFSGFAQFDSIRANNQKEHSFLKKQILPVGLIATGSLLNIGTIKNKIQDHIPNTNTHIENYFQYTPTALIYLYDLSGFKHQNSVFDQTKYYAISQIISSTLVGNLKRITKVQRPVGGKTSFPSGHTADAFVGATVLYHEFKNTEPLLAYSGYVFATVTGVLRMTNDAHWLPDVLTSAGIGMLTVNLVYHFKPLKKFQPFKREKDLTVIPLISSDSIGLLCRF
ncbi:MAG: phosphatase PAP2 family protein [Bacteroidota bacterium]